MHRRTKTALLTALTVVNLCAQEEVQIELSTAEKFKEMFSDAKVSAQIRSIYAAYRQKSDAVDDTHATALGGQFKYELASLNGFNAALGVTTSHDIAFATGEGDKNNDELSSSSGSYTQLSEAYINYANERFNFRGGRQIINTPLADSDDIRMVPNTFEAYIATCNISDFSLTAGNLEQWQGFEPGLDNGWVKAGEDGTWFGGVAYSGAVNLSLWYYNITKMTNASYADIDFSYKITNDISFLAAMQYLHESELDKSGVAADIYGAKAEISLYAIAFNIAYNKAGKKESKESFSGFGGGTLFTNLDMMIIDEIAKDRDASATVGSILYSAGDVSFLYAYGDFVGDADSTGAKAHIVEQNIGFQYNLNEAFVIAAIYVTEEDKESSVSSESDWNRLQVMVKYDF